MKTLRFLSLIICLLLADNANANQNTIVQNSKSNHLISTEQTPLVIIRFNKNSVPYNGYLELASSQAIQSKPDVVFEIVSKIPKTQHKKVEHMNRIKDVKDTLLKLNPSLVEEKVITKIELMCEVEYNEIQIFIH